jgi:rod shape-determining protein MreD
LAILFGALLSVAQAAFLPHFTLLGHTIDIVLLVVVARAILNGQRDAIYWALAGGICMDLLSALPFGTNTLALLVVAAVISFRGREIQHAWAVYPLPAAAVATLLFDMVVIIVLIIVRRDISLISAPLFITLPRALLNALAMAPVFYVVSKLNPKSRAAEGRSVFGWTFN